MKVIGVHDGHNASACLLSDGIIEFAVQEERLSRIKNHSVFPSASIKNIIDYYNIDLCEIDYFVYSSDHMPKNKNPSKLMNEYKESSSIKTILQRLTKTTPIFHYYVANRRRQRIKKAVDLGIPKEKIVFLDHHLSHAAAAYFGSPWWRDEPVLILTNDAGGDGLCATVSIGNLGQIKRICEIPVKESIGYIYSMITFLLGMMPEEHEYKVMGMAPYSSKEKYRYLLRKFETLLHFNENSNGMSWKRSNGCPPTQYSYRFLQRLTDLSRFDSVCGAIQEFLEDFLLNWVRNCIKHTGIRKLALGGGVFMNVKANKRIMELPEVDSVYVFPSCGDETNSIGAAISIYAQECMRKDQPLNLEPLGPLYFGPEFTDKAIIDVIERSPFTHTLSDNIEKMVARLLAEGEIVARFKGRMEFGARALGNRSILADPSKPDVVKTINEMIKNRDFWMPFAPSILDERSFEYIVNPKNIKSPYMIMSFDCTEKVRELIAACHPYDFTVRPQTVNESWNPEYHYLIKEFEKITSRVAILNTSFNLHGHPIVCSPSDALKVFTDSGLRFMAIGNFLVSKEELCLISPQ